MTIIETSDLTYTYSGRDNPAIMDISMSIKRGEFLIITGPSGCGKTTLCRCFNGLIPHFYSGKIEGDLVVADLRVVDHQIYEISCHVGLVFQNPENQLFSLSVEKDVAFGLENIGMARADIQSRVNWALDMTGITDLRDRAPHELSGGQQQRVAIASLLAMQPDVMVLDEPTSFLDPVRAEEIFRVIHTLNEKLDMTVILVEHKLDLASKYADRIIIMDEGKIVLEGKPREVFESKRAESIGVGFPKATVLYHLLKKQGIPLRETPISAEEASTMLREVLT